MTDPLTIEQLIAAGNEHVAVQRALRQHQALAATSEPRPDPDEATLAEIRAQELGEQYQRDVAFETEGFTQEQLNEYCERMDAYKAGMTIEDWRALRDEADEHGMSVPVYQAYALKGI